MLFLVLDKQFEKSAIACSFEGVSMCVCVNYTEMSDDFAEYVDPYLWVMCAGTFAAGVSNLWKVLVFELS